MHGVVDALPMGHVEVSVSGKIPSKPSVKPIIPKGTSDGHKRRNIPQDVLDDGWGNQEAI